MRLLLCHLVSIFWLVGVADASSQLDDPTQLKKAILRSSAVAKAQVLQRTEEWSCGGNIVTREQATKIYEQGVKRQKDIVKQFGHYESDPEAVKRLEEFYQSREGKEWGSLSCRNIVSLRVTEQIIGDMEESMNQVLSCTWKTTFGIICPHVSIDAAPGDEVLVFLHPGWKDQVVLNPDWFKLESPDLKDLLVSTNREIASEKKKAKPAAQENPLQAVPESNPK